MRPRGVVPTNLNRFDRLLEGDGVKALTLTQPWATLVAIGAKQIETRSWATPYRGPLAIHAARGLNSIGGRRAFKELCGEEPFCSVLNAFGAQLIADSIGKHPLVVTEQLMPFGAIVATCNLVACVPTAKHHDIFLHLQEYKMPEPLSNEFAFGDYSPNRYMWFLKDVERLVKPIPIAGHLSLWEWDEKGRASASSGDYVGAEDGQASLSE